MNCFCIHYPTGGMGENKVCKIEVEFASLTPQDKWKMPCWDRSVKCCPLAQYPRKKQQMRLFSRRMAAMVKFMRHETTRCFRCRKKVRSLRQEGRHVYGSCGCRMWQGRIPIDWREAVPA